MYETECYFPTWINAEDAPHVKALAEAQAGAGEVIPGLYCVGNLGGPFYGGADYPFHQTGLSLGRCYTFGMIAAKHAMGAL